MTYGKKSYRSDVSFYGVVKTLKILRQVPKWSLSWETSRLNLIDCNDINYKSHIPELKLYDVNPCYQKLHPYKALKRKGGEFLPSLSVNADDSHEVFLYNSSEGKTVKWIDIQSKFFKGSDTVIRLYTVDGCENLDELGRLDSQITHMGKRRGQKRRGWSKTKIRLKLKPIYLTYPMYYDQRLQKEPHHLELHFRDVVFKPHLFKNASAGGTSLVFYKRSDKNSKLVSNCSLLQVWFEIPSHKGYPVEININKFKLKKYWGVSKYILHGRQYLLFNLDGKIYRVNKNNELYTWNEAWNICRHYQGELFSPYTTRDVETALNIIKMNSGWTASVYLGIIKQVKPLLKTCCSF